MRKIFISTSSFGEFDRSPVNLLNDAGFETAFNPHGRTLVKGEIVKLASGVEGIIAGTEPIDKDVLAGLSGLKVISRCGAGIDNIDLKAAGELGIKIFNTPDAPTIAVAELTLGLLLNLLRKVSEMDRDIRAGRWKKRTGNLLDKKTVGIVGFGKIGKKVAELLRPFGCALAYYDIKDTGPEQKYSDVKRMQLADLLATSDVILVHASTCSCGCYVIGENEIKMMKKNAWIVNTSRGGALDERALYSALKNGSISGAALDVFEREPYDGPLKKMENVILTPHAGSYAREARIRMEMESARNLLKGLEDIK